jgi:glycosyltransferase involved in cell wall biosynthesis
MLPPRAREIWGRVSQGKVTLPGTPDLVHANCFQAPRVGKVPLVFTLHDVSFWTHPEYTTDRNRVACQRGTLEAIEHAAGFMFVSESAQLEFEKLFPGLIKKKQIHTAVVHHGSRFPFAKPRSTYPTGGWLAVGSLEPRKNYETALDALEIYWKKSVHPRPLTIAGGIGWKSEKIKERIQELQKRGLVKYEGYVTDARLHTLYESAFGLLFPSHYEGFGLPVVEAMSQGCPVITRAHSSLTEVGGNAAIYCQDDPEEMAETMLRLETDLSYYLEMSTKSLEQSTQFGWDRAAKKVLQLYEKILVTDIDQRPFGDEGHERQ